MVIRTSLMLACGLAVTAAGAGAQDVPTVAELISQATSLHDQQQFNAAIAVLQEALRRDPDNTVASYELAFSQSAAGDYEACAATAQQALAKAKTYRTLLFAVAGGCLDIAGKSRAAVALCRQGLGEFPEDPELAYNCGIAELGLRHHDEARALAKTAIRGRPRHARSHDLLARAYLAAGYVTPAVLASLHGLALEPEGPDARGRAEFLVATLRRGATQESDSSTTILLPSDRPKDEGDFAVTDLMLALAAAGRFTKEGKAKSEAELLAEQIGALATILHEAGTRAKPATSFAWDTYTPLLLAVHDQKLVEAFVYHLTASLDLPGAQSWRAAHAEQMTKVKAVLDRLLPEL